MSVYCGLCGDKLPKQRCSENQCVNRDDVFEDFVIMAGDESSGASCSLEHEGNNMVEEVVDFKLNYV